MIDLWNKTFLFTPLFLSYVHMKAIGFFPLLVLATVWNGSGHFRSGNNAKLDSKYENSAGFWALLNSTWNTLVETVYDFCASNNNVSCETGFKSFLSRCVTANMKAIRPLRSLQLHDYVFILQSEIANVLDGLLLIYWRSDIFKSNNCFAFEKQLICKDEENWRNWLSY